MLVARSVIGSGSGRMAWAIVFAPRLRLSMVERTGLVLDTRYVPPAPQPANYNPCLYVVLEGAVSWHLDGGHHVFVGPAAFVVSEEHLEGGDGKRSALYRTDPHR